MQVLFYKKMKGKPPSLPWLLSVWKLRLSHLYWVKALILRAATSSIPTSFSGSSTQRLDHSSRERCKWAAYSSCPPHPGPCLGPGPAAGASKCSQQNSWPQHGKLSKLCPVGITAVIIWQCCRLLVCAFSSFISCCSVLVGFGLIH